MRSRTNKLALGLLCIALLVSIAACSKETEKPTVVKIGLATPETGSGADYGRLQKQGAQLAIDQINAAGGINGVEIELVVKDDRLDTREASNVAKAFVSSDVVAVIGHLNTPCCQAAAPVYEEGKLPMLVALASNPTLPGIGDYIFQVSPNQPEEAGAAAYHVVKDLGHEKVAFVYMNNDWGKAVQQVFVPKVAEYGGTIVCEEAFLPGDADFTVLLTKVKNLNPDVIYVAAEYAEGGQLVHQAVTNVNIKTPMVLSGGAMTSAFLDIAGTAGEGIDFVVGFYAESEDPTVVSFVSAAREKYNETPGIYQTFVYDAVNIVAKAIENAGAEKKPVAEARDAIQKALMELKDVQTVLGVVSANDVGFFGPHAFNSVVVKDGKYTFDSVIVPK
jgi:branched-chain amino acid transport system substrate-binding protein